jgi:hypothetical protein
VRKRRIWRKLHLALDEATGEIRHEAARLVLAARVCPGEA